MKHASVRHGRGRSETLHALLGRGRPAPSGPLQWRQRYRPRLEFLEDRIAPATSLLVGPDINITKSTANEAETSIALNPTNPNNLFAIDTATFQGRYSTDGGGTSPAAFRLPSSSYGEGDPLVP